LPRSLPSRERGGHGGATHSPVDQSTAARRPREATGPVPLTRPRHDLQLHDAARLLLLQVLPPLLDVYVVPRQQFGHGPVALRIPGRVDAQVRERLPPHLRLETFLPAVQTAAAPPGLLQGRCDAPVSPR